MQPNRYGICEKCALPLNNNFCKRCGRHKVGLGAYCGECAGQDLRFDEARSAVNFDETARALVHRLKYGGARYLVPGIVEFMLDVLFASGWEADRLTFVPMHKKRRKQRGYNQAELLARELSRRTDLPCEELLLKTVYTVNQAKLDRKEREENLRGSFASAGRAPERVILVDDVMTTGSTASECASVLKKHGAKFVYLLTFASVPEYSLTDKPVRNIKDFHPQKT